jgi:LacI family transcriptional regulator
MASLKDIAKLAGTSVSTVSLVLNNRDTPVRISQTTRQQVLEAARTIGYTPNVAARRLRASRDKMQALVVGIIMPFDERLHVSSRVIAGVHAALNKYAQENSLAPADIIIETYERNNLKGVASLKESSSYNGAILLNTSPEDDYFLEQVGPLLQPMVLINRTIQGHNWVNINHREMGRQVAAHLAGLGHTRMGTILPNLASAAVATRLEGFQEYLRQRLNLEIEPGYTMQGAFSEVGGYQAASQMFQHLAQAAKPYPTALFVASDVMAVGTLHAIKEIGLSIPDDIAVVGFDNDPIASFTDPPLTTIDSKLDEIAEAAATSLLSLIFSKDKGSITKLFEAELIVRSSCGASKREPAEVFSSD